MTVDPVKNGMNWYAYVNGDPVNLWDPLGLETNMLDPDLFNSVVIQNIIEGIEYNGNKVTEGKKQLEKREKNLLKMLLKVL